MYGLKAIYKKELKTFFYSPVGYILLGVFFLFMGVVFTSFVNIYEQYSQARMMGRAQGVSLDQLASSLYQSALWFLSLFVAPLITMRLYAEEKKQQTLELLLTSPVKGFELITGKFFSAMSVMFLILLGTFMYSFFMMLWGNPDTNIVFTTYLGLFLTLGCYVAVGGFFSAFCTNPMIAAILALFCNGFLWLFAALGPQMRVNLGPVNLGDVLTYITPLTHFNGFAEGIIHLRSVVYCLTFIVLFLFLTHRVVESNRWR